MMKWLCSSASTGLYYLQSRYYDPAVGRFLNADIYISTGQGLLGYNMFAYCNNNPVMCSDSSGHAACTWDGGFCGLESMAGLVDTSGGGGRVAGIPGCNGESARRHSAEIIQREKDYIRGRIHEMASNVGDALYSVGTTLWDAYMRGHNLHQYSQTQEAQLMLDGATEIYTLLDETEIIDVAKYGWHTVQAVNEAKKALAYWVAPIPTPIDEYFAVCHAIKALYHLYQAGQEGF